MFKEILALIQKDIRLEWRQKSAFNGILLYLVSTVFVSYLSFNLKKSQLQGITWNALFWIILLFTAVNTISKSFLQESEDRQLYYFTLVSPESMILSKMIYNSLLMFLMSGIALFFYTLFLDNPVLDQGLFLLNLFLGSLGFSLTLTMIAGIASKVQNSSTLMAVLSFPVVLPLLLLLIRVSKNAIDGLDRTVSEGTLLSILALNGILAVLSYILFPYLWKS
ncbi:MAG: ABC transporter permease [Bacteroidetes bacterium]|nr:MAG: ABC transporter permease [Bacteroidota bacterium]